GPEDVLTGDRRSVKESTSDIGHLDPAPGRCLGCADLRIPVPAAGPGGDDQLPDLFVRGPLPENGSEILARRVGKETGVQLPIGRMLWSFTPRLTTMLIFTAPKPARVAASIPSSTRPTENPTSLIAPNVASSRASRLTVTRPRPAWRSAAALSARRDPLGVR